MPMRRRGCSPPAEHPSEQAPFSIGRTQSATVFMTLAEVAEELSVSVSTVMRWVQRGELPAIELRGGRKRVHRQTFNLWLTSLRTADLPALERD
jgi:excisionase family DNA binding protein